MIKTLRITSILAVALAVVLFVLPAVFGVRSDEQAERFLTSAGVIEQFNQARGQKTADSKNQTSPLVKQAEQFALYLDPPPESKSAPTTSDRPTGAPRPETVSAKFGLIGTSFYSSHPGKSLALVDEPGKGLRWVRQGGQVGRLIIEQVKDGLVVVRDGERTFEMVAERPEKVNLVKGASASASSDAVTDRTRRPRKTVSRIRAAPQYDEEEGLDEILAELGDIEKKVAGFGEDDEMVKFISKTKRDLMASRISDEEARRLDHLGRELEDNQSVPGRYRPNRYETESDANLDEPNFAEPDVYDPNSDDPNFAEPNVYDPNSDEPNFDEPNPAEPDVYDPNFDEPNDVEPNTTDEE